MIFYSPLISWYKSRRGACPRGEEITFRAALPRSFGATACYLVISRDGREDECLPMSWEQTDGNSESWIITYCPVQTGPYFYRFMFDGGFGRCPISKKEGSFDGVIGEGGKWQLTVYDENFRTPGFIKGGLIYQIFPDRFYCSGKKKENVPEDRILRSDYDNLPCYEDDGEGNIPNNDYFCGDFDGITEKLGYLSGLGVTCIYLNPVAEAHSNHRYDTADYMKPDPLLGTEDDFRRLCDTAAQYGISVIIDGVYSHTGADSVYFNKFMRYGQGGAYNDKSSPYYRWYNFGKDRDDYLCWWNVKILPEVNENDPSFTEFITGRGGVADYWLSLGASGIRLDVADELPNEFLDKLRAAVKRNSAEKLLLGEVWEDATNKISGGGRRRFLLGDQLDCVMNYPFRDAVVDFVMKGEAEKFMNSVVSVVDNYPPQALHCCMNHLGTHDTARILTVLSGGWKKGMSRARQYELTLNSGISEQARVLYKAALAINFFLPGVPSVYYGDEAGLTGGDDPFNRRFFPWGKEDSDILSYVKEVSAIRRNSRVCRDGGFYPLSAERGCIAFLRYKEGEKRIAVISNMNREGIDYTLNPDMKCMRPLLGGEPAEEYGAVHIPPLTTCVISDE